MGSSANGLASSRRTRLAPLPLRLFDVTDGERFVGSIAARSRLRLSFHDAEDLRQYLLIELWQLATRYNEESDVSFATWAGTTLRLRVIDWERKRWGRTKWKWANGVSYERPRRTTVSLDDGDDLDFLGGTVGEGSGDLETGWDSNLGRLLGEGRGSQARDHQTLGLQPPRRAAG